MKKSVLSFIVVFIVIIVVGFAIGELQALYNNNTGVRVSTSETNMFHKSKGFTDGMIQDLSKHKLELAEESNVTARKAIVDYINDQFANFDETTINNQSLRQFLIDCRSGNIK